MNKWLLLYLVFNILAGTLPENYAISIFKLGNLVEHYHLHQDHSHEHSIFHFISTHYTDKHHEDDHESHKNLPFHHHHDQPNPVNQVAFLLPMPCLILFFPKLDIVSKQVIVRKQSVFPSHFAGDIWQPPKV